MKIYKWLLPLSWLYDAVTRLRNTLFDRGVLHEEHFDIPVIAVGNLTAGGTGKTPHVELLLRHLLPDFPDHRLATLSRGYGRTTKGLLEVSTQSSADAVGDEPLQMKRKFPSVRVLVDEDRREGIRHLLERHAEVVLLDDAFQHRYVKPGLNILLTDYSRLYTDDALLPAGRLREHPRGAERADVIIVTKCPPALTAAEMKTLRARLHPRIDQYLFFTYNVYGTPRPLFKAPPYTPSPTAAVVTGIARPEPLQAHVGQVSQVVPVEFPDHHRFSADDIRRIDEAVAAAGQGITTEKDAVRLHAHMTEFSEATRASLYVQPIEVCFHHEQESLFLQIIHQYVRTNQRNSRMA